MAVNKVVVNGETKIDLTGVTVASTNLLEGEKAVDKAGNPVTGSVKFSTVRTGSADPASSLGSDGDIYVKLV